MNTPDLFSARQERDRALARVDRPEWRDKALQALRLYAAMHGEFIGESFRVYYLLNGGDPPHHHNAWGALFNTAARQGWITMTDRMQKMRTGKSHARWSPMWRYTPGPEKSEKNYPGKS